MVDSWQWRQTAKASNVRSQPCSSLTFVLARTSRVMWFAPQRGQSATSSAGMICSQVYWPAYRYAQLPCYAAHTVLHLVPACMDGRRARPAASRHARAHNETLRPLRRLHPSHPLQEVWSRTPHRATHPGQATWVGDAPSNRCPAAALLQVPGARRVRADGGQHTQASGDQERALTRPLS
jgi:hypothetical protein